MEVVVSEKYVSKVLTDEANFSFEQGVANVSISDLKQPSTDTTQHLTCQAMNMQFLMDMTDSKIFSIMADVTDKLLAKRMDIVVQQGKSDTISKHKERTGFKKYAK